MGRDRRRRAELGACALCMLLAMLLAASTACQSDAYVRLSASLVTDLSPQLDFDGVFVELSQDHFHAPPSCGKQGNLFDASTDYRQEVPLGVERNVARGEVWLARVTLCKGQQVVVHRSVKETVERDLNLRVVIAESCVLGVCAGEAPCEYSRCQPNIACHWGNQGACQHRVCGSDALHNCPAGLGCRDGECLRLSGSESGSGEPRPGQEDLDAEAEGSDGAAHPSTADAGGLGMDAGDSSIGLDAALDAAAEPRDTGPIAEATDAYAEPAVDATSDARADAEAGPANDASFSSLNKARVLFVGDALATETEDVVRFWVEQSGKAEVHASVGGRLSICDFLDGRAGDVPFDKRLREQVKAVRPHLVVLQFWGDGLTPCISALNAGSQAWFDRYEADAREARTQIESAAREVGMREPAIMWVLQGPDRKNPQRSAAINLIYWSLATTLHDAFCDPGFPVSGAAFPAADPSLRRNEWVQYAPCNMFEDQRAECVEGANGRMVKLHRDASDAGSDSYNDDVLFCLTTTDESYNCTPPSSPGASRYGMVIANAIGTFLQLR